MTAKRVHLTRATLAAAMGLSVGPVHAFGVLGCDYRGGNPNNFIECVNNEANNRSSRVRDDLNKEIANERKVSNGLRNDVASLNTQLSEARAAAVTAASQARDEVRAGADHAKTSGERAVLEVSRSMPTQRVFACLERRGALQQWQNDASNLLANPPAAARDIGLRYWRAARTQVQGIDADQLIRAAQSPNPSAELDGYLEAARKATGADPAAACAAEGLASLTLAMKSSAEQLHATMEQERKQVFDERIRPVIGRAIDKAQGLLLDRVRADLERAIASSEGDLPPWRIVLASNSRGGASGLTDLALEFEPELLAQDTPRSDPVVKGGDKAANLITDVIAVDFGGIASAALVRGIVIPRLARTGQPVADVLLMLNRDPSTVTAKDRVDLAAVVREAFKADPRIRADVEIEILMGVVKSIGNNYIASSGLFYGVPGGGKLIEFAGMGLDSAVEFGFRGATSAFGSAPTGGAIVSQIELIYKGISHSVPADVAKEGAKLILITGAQAAYGKAIDELTERIKRTSGPSLDARLDTVRRDTPGFTAVFDFLQSKLIRSLAASYATRLENELDTHLTRSATVMTRAIGAP